MLLRVWCARCTDGSDPVAVVRSSTAGAVWDAHAHADVDVAEERGVRELRKQSANRLPYLVRGRTVYLMDAAPPMLAAWCIRHGSEDISTDEVRRALADPATKRIAIHPLLARVDRGEIDGEFAGCIVPDGPLPLWRCRGCDLLMSETGESIRDPDSPPEKMKAPRSE